MKVSNEVIAVLDAGTCKENMFTMVGQLDRKLYVAVDKTLKAAGGKWNRAAGSHLFDCDANDAVSDIILTGKVMDAKRDFDFFETPPKIVEMILDYAGEIEDGMLVLEPSAGSGAISDAIANCGKDLDIDVVEIREEAVQKLRETDLYACVLQSDFLSIEAREHETEILYDRILMNPPFGRQMDIHHVNHAMKMLKPGGVLVSIMSAGVLFRNNSLTVDFRDMVEENAGTIERLPPASFKSSGTNVETVIVKITKAKS